MTENMKDSKHQDERHAIALAVGFSCDVMKGEEIEPVPTSTHELLFPENSQTSAKHGRLLEEVKNGNIQGLF